MLTRSIAVGKIVICYDLYYVLAFLHVGPLHNIKATYTLTLLLLYIQ